MLACSNVPSRVLEQAYSLLDKYLDKQCHPMKHKKSGYLTLSVGYRWRMLSKNKGLSWALMSHEEYNKAKDR